MAFIDRFKRREIRDRAAAGSFIDEQSFLLGEASVHSYCRLRAGDAADALFATASFSATLNKTRWEAYPRVLTMAGTVLEASLRPHAGNKPNEMLAGLVAMVCEHFDLRPVPPMIDAVEWGAARADLERSLLNLAGQSPKSAETVVRENASFYLMIMPLHAKLGPDDFPALCSQLRHALSQIQKEFVERADLPAVAGALAALAPNIPLADAAAIMA
jgi:hypothetical protein